MSSPPESPERPVAEETGEIQAQTTDEISIGPYKLLRKLGAGGMGEVYLAEDPRLDRRVSLKMLPAHFTQEQDRVRRFVLEAKAASALNHPNIITIFDIGEANGKQYMAMEYIQGETLRQRMAEDPTISEVLDIAIQTASALNAAHRAGIIHRDIKPENVMLRPDGLVKVLDFGIAKLIERPSPSISGDSTETPADDQYATKRDPYLTTPEATIEATEPGIVLGTVTYMSPEQLHGHKIDTRSDIFSFGVMLYEVIAGTPPFAGKTQADQIAATLMREPRPMTDQRLDVPPELEKIVAESLRKDRETRFQHIEEMLNQLKELKQELGFKEKLERSGPLEVHSRTATTQQTDAQTTSSARIILSELKSHKRGSLIALFVFIAATIGLGYVGYMIYGGSENSGITSIAVLPFTNTSNDPEKEYLSDGISESLINRLSQLPGVKVIANSSSSRYKGKEADPQEVARALDITGIVTGRVSQRGDQLTVSVELIDGRDSTQVWGEQYNRKAADVLTVQGEISREIAEKLRVRLTPGQQQVHATRDSVKPEAYELLLKGYWHRSRGSAEDRRKAGEYFNLAVRVDPEYALAYAELSDIYRSLVDSSLLDPKEYSPKGKAAAQRAIELDESLAEGHYALANLQTDAWEWEEAEREYKRAIEANPNLALAHRWYSTYLKFMGRHEQALDEIKRAKELDPLSPGLNATVGHTYYFARRYNEAIEALKTTREMNQGYPYTHLFLGFTYAAKGMYREAIAAYQDAIRLGLDTPNTQIFLGAVYAQSGDRARAEAILKRLRTSKAHISAGQLAVLYAALGEREQAFTSLKKAYEARDLHLKNLGVSPGYDSMRSDPRFQDLLRRVGLAR